MRFFIALCGLFSFLSFNEALLGRTPHSHVREYNLVEGLSNIYLDPFSEKIGHTWVKGVVWDKPLIQKFYSVLKDHHDYFVFLDIGAQTGSFSLLAKFFPNSQWYAFEPLHEAAETLKTNLFLNDIPNVAVYEMAVSNRSGKGTLRMPPMNAWGLSSLGSNILRFKTVEEREVTCIDLDSFVMVNQIEKVHFIKMDTEGYELFILQGGENLITRDRPTILMEFNSVNMCQCGVHPNEVEEFLRKVNYTWQLISSEDILCTPLPSGA